MAETTTTTAYDKLNVREGRYDMWGQLHIVARVGNDGLPASAQISAVVDRLTSKNLSSDDTKTMIDLFTHAHAIPACAMKVTRTAEIGAVGGFADIARPMLVARYPDGQASAPFSYDNVARRITRKRLFVLLLALLERHTEVVEVDGGTDYRLRELERAPLYLDSGDEDCEAQLARRFEEIAGEPGATPGSIEVEDRHIAVRREFEEVVWFDFEDLCAGPRGQSDYIEIARLYHTVVVSGVPVFDANLENEARRFVALVDELYDRGVKLVLSAAAPPDALYRGERLGFEFQRTASRLIEMQSQQYLARAHRG